MNDYLVNKEDLVSIADEFRKWTNYDSKISFPNGFKRQIGELRKQFDKLVEGRSETIYSETDDLTVSILKYCISLKTLTLPKVKVLPPYCFQNLDSLELIEIPLVTEIGVGSFKGCLSLKQIVNNNISVIKKQGLQDCYQLQHLPLDKLTKVEDDGCNNAGFHQLNAPLLTEIGENGFRTCHLRYVNCENLLKVGSYSFRGNSLDLGLKINQDVAFGTEVFYDCTWVEKIKLKGYHKMYPGNQRLFVRCQKLKTFVLTGDTVVKIDKEDFEESGLLPDMGYPALGYFYVPKTLLTQYTAQNPDFRFRAIEDYPDIVDGW